MHSATVKMIIK